MDILLNLIILLVFSFLIRLPFILSHSSDEWVTWWMISKQNGRSLQYQVSDSVLPGEMGAPKLQYYLISLFPKRLWGIMGNGLNILYDCISVILVYLISFYLLSANGASTRELIIEPAMWVALLYSTTPILLPVTGRLKGVKARTLGGLFSLLYCLALGVALIGGIHTLYFAAIVFSILAILTSYFALQNILFISIILSLYLLNPIPVLAFIASILVALLIPGLGIRKILMQKIHHFRWYTGNYQGTTAEGRNRVGDFLRLPVYLFKNIETFLDLVFRKLTPVIILYSIPALFAALILLLTDFELTWSLVASNDALMYALILSLGSLIVFVLTSLKPFLFLGQAERYFEYSAAFICYLLVGLVVGLNLDAKILVFLFLIHLIVNFATFIYLQRAMILQALTDYQTSKNENILDFISNLGGDLRILTIPCKYSYQFSHELSLPNAKFYHMFVNPDEGGFAYMDRDLAEYNWPISDLSHFQDKYGINLVICSKSEAKFARERGHIYEFNLDQHIYEDADYIIYRI
jgi:hypothetical protein